MPDFLRDPVWQFMGVVVAIVVALFSLIGYLRNRHIKRLVYQVVSQHPLFTVNTLIKQKVQVLYEGTPVEDLQLLTIRLTNAGTLPITTQDIERPITVVLNPEAQILLASVSESKPANLGATITQEATRAILRPVLLNAGDALSIWILVTGLKTWEIDGRIVGVKAIEAFESTLWWTSPRPLILGSALMLVGLGITSLSPDWLSLFGGMLFLVTGAAFVLTRLHQPIEKPH